MRHFLSVCQNLTSGFAPLWHLDVCTVVEGGKGCSKNIIGARDLRGGIIPSCRASENFCQNLRSIIFIYRMTLIKELVSEDHHPAWSPPSPPPTPTNPEPSDSRKGFILSCSRLWDSWVCKVEKAWTQKQSGRKLGRGSSPFFPPPPPFSRLHALVFVCLSLMRHPYYLTAWNRLILYEIENRHKNTITYVVLFCDY